MTAVSFVMFETAIGACGIAWSDRGIAAVQLPESSEEKTRRRLRRRFFGAREASPTPEVQGAIDGIVSLLRGEASDFSAVALDLDEMPAFNRRVYEVARAIPPGATLSYGEIAAKLDEPPLAARDVGQALGQNPIPIIVPCHRVLAANGKPGGFSASGGVTTKLRLLTIEGAKTSDEPSLFESLPLASRPRRKRD
jgi:methylated-DNA-[protein]-cysteine S-methyltransferase